MSKSKIRIICFLAVIALLTTLFFTFKLDSKQALATKKEKIVTTNIGLSKNVEDGVIFHAFGWSLKSIKDNMKSIADAGYTSIQTSPINACDGSDTPLVWCGGKEDGSQGKWWWHYQPTDWKIGNYQLGSKEDLISMCDEADKYGVKIIVDVIPNHTASNLSAVSQDLIDAANNRLYHETGLIPVKDWSDRTQVTRYSMGNLPDVDTENPDFQNYFIKYLNECIDAGVDGFRYDTAKHIGLPNDTRPNWITNNFWERVTTEIHNANNIFNYGEVLQDGNERINDYITAIGAATASHYGEQIRNSIEKNNVSCNYIMNYNGIKNSDNVNFVTWVESHDNYLNDNTCDMLDDSEVKLAWAIVAGRKNGTPLFFNRPMNGGPGNKYGNNKLGVPGSNLYKDDEVSAVNFFSNYMNDASEYLRNPNNNQNLLMIERGNKGAVIVNTSYNSVTFNTETTLENGQYTSWTEDRSIFHVASGNLSATIPPRSVKVLMPIDLEVPKALKCNNDYVGSPTETYKIYYKTKWSNTNIYYKLGNSQWSPTPGVTMNTSNTQGYVVRNIKAYKGQSITVCFNNGTDWDNNDKNNYILSTPGTYTISNEKIDTGKPTLTVQNDNKIKVYYYTNWPTVYIHHNSGNGNWTYGNGVEMTNSHYPKYKETTVNIGDNLNLLACFNDGVNWDNNKKNNYELSGSETYTIKNGTITEGVPNVQRECITYESPKNTITIYYKTNWETSNIYYKTSDKGWTDDFGIEMKDSDKAGYKCITIDTGSSKTITACFNNGSKIWDNNNKDNYFFNDSGIYTVKDNTIIKGTP